MKGFGQAGALLLVFVAVLSAPATHAARTEIPRCVAALSPIPAHSERAPALEFGTSVFDRARGEAPAARPRVPAYLRAEGERQLRRWLAAQSPELRGVNL